MGQLDRNAEEVAGKAGVAGGPGEVPRGDGM